MKTLRNVWAHFVYRNGDILLSRRNHILLHDNNKGAIRTLFTLDYEAYHRSLLTASLFTRLLRSEICHILVLADGSLLVFFDGRITKLHKGRKVKEYHIETCRCPLNVEYNEDRNLVVWGDYMAGERRRPIYIYVSEDLGESWEPTFRFHEGCVRHIHNVIFDRFRNCYWILTGDEDNESGIWQSKDLRDVTPFLRSEQRYRAVSLIPTEEGLIIPTDTAEERNHIGYFSFERDELRPVQELAGSAMYAGEINGRMFVSTTYEPSRVNTHKCAEMWTSDRGVKWEKFLSIRKDLLPVKLFRLPIISIPRYERGYDREMYIFSTRSVRGGSNTLIYEESPFPGKRP